ncbi:Flp pilus assembly protein TadD, contains TPR repeats [Algoriphagus locisalis]|uniref:Flp pilus assembly protein TadD, contains TPR repeats n=1 Tax=Algoriphagus locisalis TaxID=305507 RepID=A0A1I7BX31_9BACT|nr:tetratricopeptide repeat protein [Algoriphagus locisalis]SFT91691.1 Flp pilus assembly protein TadD, contains TPR repeats [Algoriphagus locisalis]
MKRPIDLVFALLVLLGMSACDSDESKKGRFLLKGNEKMEENDPKGAMEFYSEALEMDSTFADAYYNKALAHVQLNQLSESIQDLSLAIKYKPDYYDAIFQRGLNYLDNGEFYNAREDAERLLNQDGENWKSHFLSGLVEEKLKNFSEALTAFGKAFELNPENSDLLVNQATILYYQKDFAAAKTILTEAMKINPLEPNLHNLRSMISFDEEDYAEALSSVERAIELNNSQAYFYNNKGLYLLFLDQKEEGLELINQSIKMDPKNPFALRNKGIYYVMEGDKVSALQYLVELDQNYPDMDLVKEYLDKAQAL